MVMFGFSGLLGKNEVSWFGFDTNDNKVDNSGDSSGGESYSGSSDDDRRRVSSRAPTPGMFMSFSEDREEEEEDDDGIEIILTPDDPPPPPSIIYSHIKRQTRVYSKTYILPPLLTIGHNNNTAKNRGRQAQEALKYVPPRRPQRRSHRVPILEMAKSSSGRSTPSNSNATAIRTLLMEHGGDANSPMDEYTAVKQELQKLQTELNELEQDRGAIEQIYNDHIGAAYQNKIVWDAHGLLHLDNVRRKNPPRGVEPLSSKERTALTLIRGICFTLFVQDKKGQSELLRTVGYRDNSKNGRNYRKYPRTTVTVKPGSCPDTRGGEVIRQLSVTGHIEGKAGTEGCSFFLQRDNGQSQWHGKLPDSLWRRMSDEGYSKQGDINYLSTGPQGSYYVEMKGGQCWWDTVVKDKEFHAIISQWEVYRVAFGPLMVTRDPSRNKEFRVNSWIIVSNDGKAAWKNVPSKMHELMMNQMTGIAEVTLGKGSSYFVQFLDGTISYCLPAAIAEVCQNLEQKGGFITNVSLHVESDDFIIRHTETNSET